jgi:hypothetical protein
MSDMRAAPCDILYSYFNVFYEKLQWNLKIDKPVNSHFCLRKLFEMPGCC